MHKVITQDKIDEEFMSIAIKEAKKGYNNVHPNPKVGVVITVNNKLIAKSYHKKFGGLHAERNAINLIPSNFSKATLYTTLEPCSHFGKTSPCAEHIHPSNFDRVVISSLDPNPRVNGKGLLKIKEKGIDTKLGVLEEESKKINTPFFTYFEKKRPYVILKFASTLDGFIAMEDGTSKWITCQKSRNDVHKLRSNCDGILVGRKTADIDNPDLSSHGKGRDPKVLILGSSKKINKSNKVFSKNPLFLSKENLNFSNNKLENISLVLSKLYEEKIQSVLVEGGSETLTSFLESQLFDEIHCYIAPKIFTTGIPIFNSKNSLPNDLLKVESIKEFDDDLRIIYRMKK